MTEHQNTPKDTDAEGAHPLLPIDEHVEEVPGPDGNKVRHKGIYLLPNLFTTAALFSGFTPLSAQWTATLPTRRSPFSLPWCSMAWMVASRA